MRNLKKVLTLVLTLAMLLSVMVVGAGAATFGDQESITNKEAVDVCTTLNIIGGYEDGTFRPAGNVTRAEMSKMICVALNGGQEPTMGSNLIATFNDVASTDWSAPYIEYCVSQGIVGGVGGGNFNPTGNITGTQAAKMLLCILGYNASIAGYVGSDYWETNINVDAAQKGLYAGLSNLDASAPLTRDQAAQMIWNALNAYEVEYKTTLVAGPDGTLTSKVTVQDKISSGLNTRITLLEDKYEAYTYVGDFTANAKTASGLRDGHIQLTNGSNNIGSAVATADFPYDLDIQYFGEKVKVLYKDSKTEGPRYTPDQKDTIYGVYVTGETRVVNATSNDIENEDDYSTPGKIKVNGTEYEVAAPATTSTVLVTKNFDNSNTIKPTDNATNQGADVDAAKEAFSGLSHQNGDKVKFILDVNGKVASAYVTETKLGTVTAVNSTKVSISGMGGSIELAKNDVYSGIAKDDVVVFTKLYKGTAADAYVIVEKAQTVSGKVDGFKVKSDTPGLESSKSVTVDGQTYNVYNEAAMQANVGDETGIGYFTTSHIGESVTLYLVNGYVAGAVQTSESANNYSLVIDADGTIGSALTPMKVVVLGADGNKTTLTLSDKGDTPAIGDIITYTGSNDNAKASVKADASTPYNASTAPNGYHTSTTGTLAEYDKTSKTFDGTVTAADCVLFKCTTQAAVQSVAGTDTYKAYSIRNMKDFTLADTETYSYVTDSDGKVVAVFVGKNAATATNTSDMVIGIVSAKNDTVKIGDDVYNQYTVLSNDKTYTVSIDVSNAANDTGKLAKGTIVAFAPSSDSLYDNDTDFVKLSSNSSTAVTGSPTSIDGTSYTRSDVLVKSYDSKEGLLTYFTSCSGPDGNGVYSGTGVTTKALDDDCVIIYVDVDKDTAGDGSGIPSFDSQSGKYNAIILVNTDGVISHIVIETSGEDDVFN